MFLTWPPIFVTVCLTLSNCPVMILIGFGGGPNLIDGICGAGILIKGIRIGGIRIGGTRIGGTRIGGTRIGGTRTGGIRIGGTLGAGILGDLNQSGSCTSKKNNEIEKSVAL